jgi:hypothetical protein
MKWLKKGILLVFKLRWNWIKEQSFSLEFLFCSVSLNLPFQKQLLSFRIFWFKKYEIFHLKNNFELLNFSFILVGLKIFNDAVFSDLLQLLCVKLGSSWRSLADLLKNINFFLFLWTKVRFQKVSSVLYGYLKRNLK